MKLDIDTPDVSFMDAERAVSPVIAVALMVGLAVALAGLVGVATTGIVGDLGKNPGGSVTFDQTGSQVDVSIQELDDEVSSVWIRGTPSGNVIDDNDDGTADTSLEYEVTNPSAGDVVRLYSLSQGDRITVVVDDGDGNSKTIGVFTVGDTS